MSENVKPLTNQEAYTNHRREHFGNPHPDCGFCKGVAVEVVNEYGKEIIQNVFLKELLRESLLQLGILHEFLDKNGAYYCQCHHHGTTCEFHNMLYNANRAITDAKKAGIEG